MANDVKKSTLNNSDSVFINIPPIPKDSMRTSIDPLKLLSPIGDVAVGEYLRYQPLYDQIRHARREDDADLSQGIWETNLKVANWNSVESLCINALSTKTKDLQIASWLTEAWGVLDGIKGISRGVILIDKLLEIYWDDIYPQPQNGDIDQRMQIFSWLNTTIEKRLTLVPITGMGGEPIQRLLNLADWASAEHFQAAILRSDDPGAMTTTAVRRGQVTKDIFEIGLQRALPESVATTLSDIELLEISLDNLKKTLDGYSPKDGLSFSDSYAATNNIKSLLLPLMKNREKKSRERSDNESITSEKQESGIEINGRSQAYQSLIPIANYLVSIEPHSPTPYMLAKIASWEKMSLSQIFQSLSSDPNDYPVIMKILNVG